MVEKSAQADNDESNVSVAIEPSPSAADSALETTDGQTNGEHVPQAIETIFSITIKLPHDPHETKIQVSTQEQVQDIRQSVVDQPFAMQHTCFHLEHKGDRVNDFVELSEVPEVGPDSVFTLVEDPYNEKEARMHLMRIRELIGASGDRTDTIHGIAAGLSLHDSVTDSSPAANGANGTAANDTIAHAHSNVADYKFDAPGSIKSLLPPPEGPSPKTIKSISLSPWNPPPYHLRTKGHLLYLHLITNEGEQYHITSHVSGFFVNKSSHNKFDPYPKPAPKGNSAHSLLVLIQKLSPSFDASFQSLLDFNSKREPLALFQLSNAIPASPWLVPGQADHQSDITRTQENYLMGGSEGTDTLRDWNEEFQSTRELPKETVQDKVFRERLTSKLFADYNEAATRGAVLVARGEVPPLNPTEGRDAQIFVYNNVFFSFGADGVGTFATEGGDEAARVATGKDVMGVRAVNLLDIDGLFTPGTVVVDYMGKRIVGQSIVPGIFKQREPGEHQIDYGGVEGKDVVADNEVFTPLFEKLSLALHVKKHPVWDKEGKQHNLEGSVETKGLIGTDARKYVLDLYRITPLDVPWIEQHWSGASEEQGDGADRKDYPHRMAVLRPELVVSYARDRLREWVNAELAKQAGNSDKPAIEDKNPSSETKTDTEADSSEQKETAIGGDSSTELAKKDEDEAEKDNAPRVDMSRFKFSLNPDVFAGQKPSTEEEVEQLQKDEAEVRAVCNHLTTKVIPNLIHELQEGDVGFPMDGESLSTLLHKRGINIRYLGMIASLSATDNPRLQALQRLAVQEMVSRGFKHVANQKLKHLPTPFAPACTAHLLNCLLGSHLNSKPVPETEEALRIVYSDAEFSFEKVTPESLRAEIVEQIRMRYRYAIDGEIVAAGKEVQMLREVSLKLGLQLVAKQYAFTPQDKEPNGTANGHANSGANNLSNGVQSNEGKKKKKSNKTSSQTVTHAAPLPPPASFHAVDILNFVPVLKEASPKSVLAEEAYDGGRMSLAQGQKELGQELLLESLSLYEQIYGILHPEVARVYLQLSTLYYGMDNKDAAVELARKAVIVAERTMGVDASETILAYLNLGLFEHANGNSGLALSYVLHALEMWKVVYGPNHPDSITTINNAAVMLQSMKRYHESRIWFEASLAIAEEVSGKDSVNTATLLFQLAQALALDKDSHAAVNRMRESCTIFRNVLGPDDRNTKEAETWLDQLTQSAVSLAKRDKDLKSGKLKRVQFTNRVPIGARPQMQVGQTSADAASGKMTNSRELDNRSIDELIRYIDGSDAKKTTPKKKSSNPKRRATSTAV
ncbi:protein TIF31 [Venturia nashicola]|uniref:Clustered mitochondria protein homolog n=1 Tax=Venturia nashicola TaxID=86259 RepID=A0A4Z1P6G6_9PEZI|nr:protein TIF31 [Venturia nashicola]TLD37020.1 protein TIF31 [Venturia nashicola]